MATKKQFVPHPAGTVTVKKGGRHGYYASLKLNDGSWAQRDGESASLALARLVEVAKINGYEITRVLFDKNTRGAA